MIKYIVDLIFVNIDIYIVIYIVDIVDDVKKKEKGI